MNLMTLMTVLVCSQSREAYVSRAATVFNELKKPYAPSAEDSVGSGWATHAWTNPRVSSFRSQGS